MARRRISTGSHFEELAGYCRAIVADDWVFVSGTAGFDFKGGTISDDPAEQAIQSLKTIDETLTQAGATLADIVRLRVYVSDRAHVEPVSRVLARTFGANRPTNTTIVCQFAVPEMKVELEATALIQRS
ncbi:MAG: RidA family protein [Alphaproteobacteria bacterium]|nr:RidA family protein [Alphaproteobacteria bacterium]